MSIYRSEIMLKKSMRMVSDQAVEILSEIGKMKDAIEFINLNENDNVSSKRYYMLESRCDDVERKINIFRTLCHKYGISLPKFGTYEEFNGALIVEQNINRDDQFLDYVEHTVNEKYKKLMN